MSGPLPLPRPVPVLPDLPIDAEIVARLRAGDIDVFTALFLTYYEPLVNVAWRVLNSRERSEELVQETFLRLWETRAQWVVRVTVRAYLNAAVRHAALNALRHDRIARRYADDKTTVPSDAMGSWDNDADGPVLVDELTTLLRQTLAAVPARPREAYQLRVDRGLSYAEIAEIMGIRMKTVENFIAQAKAALHAALKTYQQS